MNTNLTIDSTYKKAIEICGVTTTINNIDTKVLIKNETSEYGIDYKKVISSVPLKQGDYIFINGVQYLIYDIEEQLSQSIYNVGIIREALKITFQSSLKDVYAIVDKINGVYTQGQQITEVHDQYKFIIPKDSCKYTSLSTSNNLIIYAGGSYDAISIDDSKEGILTITGRFNNVYSPHVYTVTLNNTNASIYETASLQLTTTTTDNGTTVTSPTLVWSSSDPTIATVDNTGKVTGLKVGTCNIICNFMNVNASCNLTVNAKPVTPVISYSSSWSNTTTLKVYSSSTMTPTKTVNGVDDSANMNVTYAFDGLGASYVSSGKITIVKKTGTLNSYTIKNISITTATSIYVTFTDTVTGTKILDNQLISLKGI